jgi:glucose/arabinose dehydrogenase
VVLTPVVTQGLSSPVFVTQAPGDPSRLFVVQHRGTIAVIRNGAVEPTRFLDISSIVGGAGLAGEQGLLGLAFDPDYQKTGRFWVKYSATTGSGADTVAAYKGTPGQPADPASGRILAEISTNHLNGLGNHNGGMLAFGRDGCLYIAYGDGGGAGDTQATGQNPSDVFGSLLRIDVDRFPAPAPGNLTGPNVNPHVWDYGLRNPWRFSFDRASGDLYIGDVGQDAWEEVDVEPAETGRRNYGWNTMEAKHCFKGATCNQTGLTLPVAEYPNPPGSTQAAVVGGYVYRGSAIPGMVGRYVYADTFSKKLSSFVWSGEDATGGKICDEFPLNVTADQAISSFGQDLAGEIYVVTLQGGIYRIDPA